MYHHVKKLMYTVRVDDPDPRFGNMLLEQFGGANGELAAAMQYSIQGLNCEDPERKDLLMDIGTEELSHLEIVGALARLHLKPLKFDRESAEADPLIAIAGGGGVNLFNSQGNPWTADYLKITGELDVDLRSNIAAEARAKIVYERLINFTSDPGTKDALQFLMTREITHLRAFTAALESMNRPAFMIGKIPPTPGLVDQFFNDSTGEGEEGEIDARGPWNEGYGLDIVEAPAFRHLARSGGTGDGGIDDRTTSSASEPQMVQELLTEQLRDLLHAEGQLVKALPKMVKAARSERLKLAIDHHREETQTQVERLKEIFGLMGVAAKSRPCKGMAGLVAEGDEVMAKAEDQEDAAADLALIAAAQKIEHYEISAYGTARTMAGQVGLPAVAELLSKTLAEEEVSDNLLTQLARELMSEVRTGTTNEGVTAVRSRSPQLHQNPYSLRSIVIGSTRAGRAAGRTGCQRYGAQERRRPGVGGGVGGRYAKRSDSRRRHSASGPATPAAGSTGRTFSLPSTEGPLVRRRAPSSIDTRRRLSKRSRRCAGSGCPDGLLRRLGAQPSTSGEATGSGRASSRWTRSRPCTGSRLQAPGPAQPLRPSRSVASLAG